MIANGIDRAIEALARHQHGAFSTRQASALGATPRIRERRRGRWLQLSRSVWALPSAPPTWHRQVTAAVLSLDRSVVSGLAAGHLHGMEGFRPVRPELTVPRGGSRRSPFATVHQSDRFASTRVGGLPVVTVEQALCDVAGRLSAADLEAVIEAAIVDGRTSAHALLSRAEALRPRPPRGVAELAELARRLGADDAVPTSVLEALLFRILRDPRIPEWSAQATPVWWPRDDERLDVGTYLQQASHQAGALQASLPAITGLEPVVGMVLGLTLFDERFRAHGPLAVGLLATAMIVAGVAVVVLARAQGRADSLAVVPGPLPEPA